MTTSPDDTGKKILLISMPTLGQISTHTTKALIGLTQYLQRNGIPFGFETYEFSDIVFSRNQLICSFFTKKQFTHMLCLDSDMAFEPQAVQRLIDIDVDFAATAYPQKHPRWARLRQIIEAEAHLPEDQKSPMDVLLSRTWVYNHQKADFGGKPWTPKRRAGFITVPATGTGMMLLSRRVPESMVEKGVVKRKPRLEQVPLHKGLEYYDFFSHLSSPDGGLMYGEDQSFCMRWTHHCDGEIWLDTESPVTHYGEKTHTGRYAALVDEEFKTFEDLD
ncbi:MAG: hypothetical protein AAFP68_02595 [Pseudomonadota bacterium]